MNKTIDTVRRRCLQAIGSAIGLSGLSSQVGANPTNQTEVNVGYTEESGRQAAIVSADEVEREFVFNALTIELPEQAIDGLQNRPDIRYVEDNGIMEAFQETPWGVERVGARAVHDGNETGSGGSVAVIDTGIDATHEDLEANLGQGEAFVDCSGSECTEPWGDDNSHGTHVAGTAGALDNDIGVVGVAPDVTLHAVKVLDGDGAGTFSDIAAGVEWTADQGIDVGNLSLGSNQGSNVVEDACQYATEQGTLLVAAAGNSGPCTDCVAFPAAYDECIAVSATDEDDNLAGFSSTGPQIELAAPGVSVLSTVPNDDYTSFSGTSMAAPHVAGAGAMLMTDSSSNTEARERLNETAEDIGLEESEQGNGLLDVATAIDTDNGDTVQIGDNRTFSEMNRERSGQNVGNDITVDGESETFLDADRGVAITEVESGTGTARYWSAVGRSFTTEGDNAQEADILAEGTVGGLLEAESGSTAVGIINLNLVDLTDGENTRSGAFRTRTSREQSIDSSFDGIITAALEPSHSYILWVQLHARVNVDTDGATPHSDLGPDQDGVIVDSVTIDFN